MPDELSEAALNDDLEEIAGLGDFSCWEITQPRPLTVVAAMRPAANPEERYMAVLKWSRYPDAAPSLKFADEKGGLGNANAWPVATGFRPTSLDACVPWTAEGLALHPDWERDPRYRWDARHNPLLRILRTIQDLLDDAYGGRHGV